MITKTDPDRWNVAQANEFTTWMNAPKKGDDWNRWWAHHFNDYRFLVEETPHSIMEVGCGPYANNLRNVLSVLPNKPEVALNDPLLEKYIQQNFSVTEVITEHRAKLFPCPLEEISLDKTFDCIICINVLDHVYDVKQCMEKIKRLLTKGGILIFGQDLTNEQDVEQCPEMVTDKMHPIRFDLDYINEFLKSYYPIYSQILPREQGRNPKCHHATLLYSGKRSCANW